MAIITDDIFFYLSAEDEMFKTYDVCYSMAGHHSSYKDRCFAEKLQAIRIRCAIEKERMDRGDHFNNFEKWDTLRVASEQLGYVPDKFSICK